MNKNVNTFGSYIRNERILKKISQRDLAKQLGISAPYLNDIEKNKRFAPRTELVRVISHILEADLEILHDLAAKSKNTIASDIEQLLREKPEVVSLLRSINFHNLTKKKFWL
jgi:transcriptional regulator with XRE-family HTH domain